MPQLRSPYAADQTPSRRALNQRAGQAFAQPIGQAFSRYFEQKREDQLRSEQQARQDLWAAKAPLLERFAKTRDLDSFISVAKAKSLEEIRGSTGGAPLPMTPSEVARQLEITRAQRTLPSDKTGLDPAQEADVGLRKAGLQQRTEAENRHAYERAEDRATDEMRYGKALTRADEQTDYQRRRDREDFNRRSYESAENRMYREMGEARAGRSERRRDEQWGAQKDRLPTPEQSGRMTEAEIAAKEAMAGRARTAMTPEQKRRADAAKIEYQEAVRALREAQSKTLKPSEEEMRALEKRVEDAKAAYLAGGEETTAPPARRSGYVR
jgi:hypothetical protein